MNYTQAADLGKQYDQSLGLVTVLDRVSLSVESGEFLAVMGSLGSGKSTLLALLMALARPSRG